MTKNKKPLFVFKFVDKTDGNVCFVIHSCGEQAKKIAKTQTSLEIECIDSKEISKVNLTGFIFNRIIPF